MYASALFILSFVCLMFGATNAAVISYSNADSNVNHISRNHSPQGAVLVKRNYELLAQTDDGILGDTGGDLGRAVSPILRHTDKGVTGKLRQRNERSGSRS